jgi:hypothetical protein
MCTSAIMARGVAQCFGIPADPEKYNVHAAHMSLPIARLQVGHVRDTAQSTCRDEGVCNLGVLL